MDPNNGQSTSATHLNAIRHTTRATAGIPAPRLIESIEGATPRTGQNPILTQVRSQRSTHASINGSTSAVSTTSVRKRRVAADLEAAQAEMEARLKVINLRRELAHAELDEEEEQHLSSGEEEHSIPDVQDWIDGQRNDYHPDVNANNVNSGYVPPQTNLANGLFVSGAAPNAHQTPGQCPQL